VQASISLTEGEIMQARFRRNPAVTFADYLEIVTRKTAALFEQSARTAASLADAPARALDAMARCGLHVGLTFQIVDDLLDVVGDEAVTGKPAGIDVREGNPSLPIVLALSRDDVIRNLFARSDPSDGDVTWILNRLRRSPVIQESKDIARRHAATAREALAVLRDSPYRQNLLWLIDELVDRVS
jgi:octaprenyl-diphosphate synthase